MHEARIVDGTNKKKRELLPSRQQPLLITVALKGPKAYYQGRHSLASGKEIPICNSIHTIPRDHNQLTGTPHRPRNKAWHVIPGRPAPCGERKESARRPHSPQDPSESYPLHTKGPGPTTLCLPPNQAMMPGNPYLDDPFLVCPLQR
ncbi:predicted protein [Lichtheimia corymbifera JMRC:FSU:9682]|uniref:Uncharacterized protein n=1 Tax=Lichtheimia corymbifera JMRC:FSU:9682 TaxID=1263082 RepID=A0A068S3Y2_9FUNG|nr:predicted protein [Lichtheimia corymbifera JMRC:FSU:9682]